MLKNLLEKSRSVRVFDEKIKLSDEQFYELINLARLSPVGKNQRSYLFYPVPEKDLEKIYPCLRWANALPEWGGPKEGQRPGSVILVLTESKTISPLTAMDIGVAIQSVMLGACDMGLGGCIIRSIDHQKMKDVLGIKKGTIQLALAIGKPAQKCLSNPIKAAAIIGWMRTAIITCRNRMWRIISTS